MKSENNGSETGKQASQQDYQKNLKNSGKQTNGLKKRWHLPTDLKELSAQVNEVANMVMNDEIDIAKASKYATLARTIAQIKSIEVLKARLEKTAIKLELK